MEHEIELQLQLGNMTLNSFFTINGHGVLWPSCSVHAVLVEGMQVLGRSGDFQPQKRV